MIDLVNAARPRPHTRLVGDADLIWVSWLLAEGEKPYRIVRDPVIHRDDWGPYLASRGCTRWGHQLSEEAAQALVRGGIPCES